MLTRIQTVISTITKKIARTTRNTTVITQKQPSRQHIPKISKRRDIYGRMY